MATTPTPNGQPRAGRPWWDRSRSRRVRFIVGALVLAVAALCLRLMRGPPQATAIDPDPSGAYRAQLGDLILTGIQASGMSLDRVSPRMRSAFETSEVRLWILEGSRFRLEVVFGLSIPLPEWAVGPWVGVVEAGARDHFTLACDGPDQLRIDGWHAGVDLILDWRGSPLRFTRD